MQDDDLIPQRPYLYRAMHEWMTDCGHTPQIVVDATAEGASIPPGFAEDGRIVLNVSYSATRNLEMTNDEISFQARFAGKSFAVRVPASAVLAIYARETGEGMVFSEPQSTDDAPDASAAPGRIADSAGSPPDQAPSPTTGDEDKKQPPSRGRSHLRVIK